MKYHMRLVREYTARGVTTRVPGPSFATVRRIQGRGGAALTPIVSLKVLRSPVPGSVTQHGRHRFRMTESYVVPDALDAQGRCVGGERVYLYEFDPDRSDSPEAWPYSMSGMADADNYWNTQHKEK